MSVTATSLPAAAGPETLNKVVASVGYDAITQRDLIEEYHLERFLNGNQPVGTPSATDRQSALDRLIRQTLLKEQMRGPAKGSKNERESAEETLNEVRKKFSNEEAYHSALQSLGMTEEQVLTRLEWYQRTLRMINSRLRPAALPDPSEVEEYYKKTFLPEYAKGHSGTPPRLDDVQDQIREILVQKKMNQLLENWLERLKSSHRVTIHSY